MHFLICSGGRIKPPVQIVDQRLQLPHDLTPFAESTRRQEPTLEFLIVLAVAFFGSTRSLSPIPELDVRKEVRAFVSQFFMCFIGGLLLLELPAKVFEFAVPPLILFSALIIALNPRKKAAARDAVAQALPQSHQGERAARIASKTADGTLRNDPWWLWAGVSFVGVYSGYFGAAAGTLALAILDLGKIGPFHQINALKTVVGFGANISAAIMFIIRGSVDWPFAIMMCLGCTIGSAIAPPVTRHIPENIMRAAAVLTGIILAAKLGWSTYF